MPRDPWWESQLLRMIDPPPPRHPCPVCGAEVEGYTIRAALMLQDRITGQHWVRDPRYRYPDPPGAVPGRVERLRALDLFALEPCGCEVSREAFEGLAAAWAAEERARVAEVGDYQI